MIAPKPAAAICGPFSCAQTAANSRKEELKNIADKAGLRVNVEPLLQLATATLGDAKLYSGEVSGPFLRALIGQMSAPTDHEGSYGHFFCDLLLDAAQGISDLMTAAERAAGRALSEAVVEHLRASEPHPDRHNWEPTTSGLAYLEQATGRYVVVSASVSFATRLLVTLHLRAAVGNVPTGLILSAAMVCPSLEEHPRLATSLGLLAAPGFVAE